MPPGGRPRPDEASYRGPDHVPRNVARPRGGRETRPRPHGSLPSAQPRRISERGPRSAGARHRRDRDAAGRRCELRLRQHRRRAADVSDVDGALSERGAEDQRRGGRRDRRRPPSPRRSTSRPSFGRTIAWTACRSAHAAARRCTIRSRETANTAIRVQLTRMPGRLTRFRPTTRAAARAQYRRRADARLRAAAEAPRAGADDPARGEDRRALDADWQIALPAKAGPHTVTLTFLNRTPALLENLLEPFEKPVPGGPNGYYPTQKGAYLRKRGDQRPVHHARAPARHAEPPPHLRVPARPGGRTKPPARRRSSPRMARRAFGGR